MLRRAVMGVYQEVRLVMVLPDEGQTFGDQLTLHFFTTNVDLHPGLQVKNAAIRLDATRKNRTLSFSSELVGKSHRGTILLLLTRSE